jgi:hypothetical protein
MKGVSAQYGSLAYIIAKAFVAADDEGGNGRVDVGPDSTIQEVEDYANSKAIPLDRLLSEAALESYSVKRGADKRKKRDGLDFILADKRKPEELTFTKDPNVNWSLDTDLVLKAVQNSNHSIELIDDLAKGNDIPIFALLGLRNLSSFVGEIFASEIHRIYSDKLMPNPNQDGYPDLLARTPDGSKYISERERNAETSEKKFWSPYPYGGIEVKATCGNVVSAKVQSKPKIGESRIPSLVSAEWKAHHRDTNNLLGIFWDFVDELPTVLAVFFRNDLSIDDWGVVIQPKEGGGRTTSVSIMKKRGVKRMGEGWLLLPKDEPFRNVICQKKVFSITATDIRSATNYQMS